MIDLFVRQLTLALEQVELHLSPESLALLEVIYPVLLLNKKVILVLLILHGGLTFQDGHLGLDLLPQDLIVGLMAQLVLHLFVRRTRGVGVGDARGRRLGVVQGAEVVDELAVRLNLGRRQLSLLLGVLMLLQDLFKHRELSSR